MSLYFFQVMYSKTGRTIKRSDQNQRSHKSGKYDIYPEALPQNKAAFFLIACPFGHGDQRRSSKTYSQAKYENLEKDGIGQRCCGQLVRSHPAHHYTVNNAQHYMANLADDHGVGKQKCFF